MQFRMSRKDNIPLPQWEEFLVAARRAGATADTTVDEEIDPLDPEQMIGYTIDVTPGEDDEDDEGPASVTVPADILHGLLFVTRQVASSEGDVRGLEGSAQRIIAEFNEHFLTPVLGPNPYADGERHIAEFADGQGGDGDA
jgi:hypothetical protein